MPRYPNFGRKDTKQPADEASQTVRPDLPLYDYMVLTLDGNDIEQYDFHRALDGFLRAGIKSHPVFQNPHPFHMLIEDEA